ncbi:RNA polymerase sigma factor, sigma-70 family [Chitinophaga costaii]|uniref:RNA polymerase sigma factor, sigma-70 family n=1 Tax=Chitinophaga costaii TaxID=1335309 RepID=A0A1C4CCX8_9BACT|nr:sigma-70 family RNA polymerase sigma factor [Chitinophaga costaii]PUZ27143.1 sigma-70 family RNA polymerase sigma factor [Chitinophaga costaii]SCC16843.1 RNA polymerase sigma factor, sigma-70 family [Chitinophaga costaii]
MQQQLNNLSDKELIVRNKKGKDPEAEAVLLERYGHLIVAACLPWLNAERNAGIVFPALLEKLRSGLKTDAIYKVNEWLHQYIRNMQNKQDKPLAYPSREKRSLLGVEQAVESALTNTISTDSMANRLANAMGTLSKDEQQALTGFYIDGKSFNDMAKTRNITTEKVRLALKSAKRKLAVQMMEQTYGQ